MILKAGAKVKIIETTGQGQEKGKTGKLVAFKILSDHSHFYVDATEIELIKKRGKK